MRWKMKSVVVVLFVAGALTGCGPDVSTIASADPKLATQSGQREASGVIQAIGQPGYLVFGPYMQLKPGTYQLVAKGKLSGTAKKLGMLDVATEKGERILMMQPIYADGQVPDGVITTAAFEVDRQVTDAEFRLFVEGNVKGTFNGYELVLLQEKK